MSFYGVSRDDQAIVGRADLANVQDMTQGVALVGGAGRVVASIAALKTLPKTGSQSVFVTGYYAAGDGGGGQYRYDASDTSSTDNAFTIIVANDGGRWKLQWYGILSILQGGVKADGVSADDTAVINALSVSAGLGTDLICPAGRTSKLTGTATIAIDMSLTGLCSLGGFAFDCSGMNPSSGYCFQLFGSQTYFTEYKNAGHKFYGIFIIGVNNGTVPANKHGLLIGHATDTQNSEFVIERGGVIGFDRNIELTNNAWRVSFDHHINERPLNYSVYAASGLSNFGEALQFRHCKYSDGASGSTTPQFYIGSSLQWEFYGCSLLNQTLNLAGQNVNAKWYGGNIENPASVTAYTYITLTGSEASLALIAPGITFNQLVTYTDAVIKSNDATQRIYVSGLKIPDINNTLYTPQANVGNVALIGGPASVIATGTTYWPTAGGNKPLLSMTNGLRNGGFEENATTGWTVAPYGGAPQGTATVINTDSYGPNSTYSLQTVAGAGAGAGVNVYQDVAVSAGQYVVLWAMVHKTVTGSGYDGQLSFQFYDAAGNTIGSSYANQIGNTAGWFANGNLKAYAPNGAAKCRVTLNAQTGATINWDNVVLNVI